VDLQDDVKKFKTHIIEFLQSSFHAYIPPINNLIYQGTVTTPDTKKMADLHPDNDDNFLFLYDLTAKPAPQPAPESATQTLIDSLVSSWSQMQNYSNPLQNPLSAPIGQTPPGGSQNVMNPETQRATMLKIIQSDDFFPDQEGLGLLMSMGFSKSRAKKALVINYFEPQAAAEWLLMHSYDPDIDTPLTEAQINQLLNRDLGPSSNTGIVSPPVPQQSMETLLQNAIKNRTCTFMVTKQTHANQNWYHCFTCGLVDSEGVCESCMNVCHDGHVISEVKTGLFYCDCGHNKTAHNCQCFK
jgi:hypothetical protein